MCSNPPHWLAGRILCGCKMGITKLTKIMSFTQEEVSLEGIKARSKAFRHMFDRNGGHMSYEVRAVEVLLDEIERLTRERDEWCEKWQRMRTMYAELKYPGMKGIVKPADCAVEPRPHEKTP